MLPGKKYKPEDILQIAWRYRWLIVVPFVVVALGTAFFVQQLPDMYRSSTLVLVVLKQVPDAYVRPTGPTRMEEILPGISQQLTTRTIVEQVIRDLNLYQPERGSMEAVVERVRSNIQVNVGPRTVGNFTVSFVSHDPREAKAVAERLTSAFLDNSRSDRAVQAEVTTDFLQTQLDEARRRLVDHEEKLADYQRRHAGELPSEREANVQVLNNTQMQLQQLLESVNRDRDARYLKEKSIGELESQAPTAVSVGVPAAGNDPLGVSGGSTAERLEAARAQLRAYELRLTQEHADIRRAKRVIAELETQAKTEEAQRALSPAATPAAPLSQAEQVRQDRLAGLRIELEALDRQIEAKKAEEQRLRGVINAFQARLGATPTRESELIALTRDYQTLQTAYQSLLAKQEDAKISANLQRVEIGEQFRVLDPARVPGRPFSPNRPLFNLMGVLAGLGIGVGLAMLMEYRDSSFRTDSEVVRVLSLPVLAVIPVMMTTAEKRKVKRRRVRVVAAAATTCIAAAVILAWRFDLWNRLTR